MRVDWSGYRRNIENVPGEDGGGYRIFYPTLGYAVYGVGDTLDEAMSSLKCSQAQFDQFVAGTPGYMVPEPSIEDHQHRIRTASVANGTECCNNFAYAA